MTEKEIRKQIKDGTISWNYISECQTLSEEFIREFEDKVNWYNISTYQTLSEDFIKEFENKVDWNYISERQTLSEDFIKEFENKVNWYNISAYQTLSEEFIREFNITVLENNWLYTSKEDKLKYVKENTQYEVIENEYILAYKTVKNNYCSVFKQDFFYEVGKTYVSHCDCNLKNENSFGLSAWTKEKALEYHNKGKLLKVKIFIEDIGAIVHNNNKIRCKKLTVIEEIKK